MSKSSNPEDAGASKTTTDLEKMRHSLSHIMAAAIQELYPDVKFGIGPAIENGFYYDIDFGKTKISEEDLPKIEKKMRGIITRNLPIERAVKSRKEALEWARETGQDYKFELINELPADEEISFYTLGDFIDLCRGPHLKNTGEVGVFKLDKIAGAYWRGDEKNEMLTRLYGIAFDSEAELKRYIDQQEEAKNAIIANLEEN